MSELLVRRWRVLTLASQSLLLIVVVAWQLEDLASLTSVLRVAVFSIPLLLPLHGVIKGSRYTYRWATLCVLPYFVVALTEAFANPIARAYGVAMLGASLLWFFSLIAYLRVSAPAATN